MNRMEKIAEDLLKSSRGNQTSLTKLPIEKINSIIEALIPEKNLEFGEKVKVQSSYQLSCHNPEGLAFSINKTDLERVLSNLINNSFESMTEYRKKFINVSTKISEGNQLMIVVEDNSKGIPSDKLDLIFRKGFSSGKAKGTGLGLYNCRKVVEYWGGEVLLESTFGQGTEITIVLPPQD